MEPFASRSPTSETTWAPFGLGFRPFFLAAGLAAVVLLTVWLTALRGPVRMATYYDRVGGPIMWHAHEMLFGYVGAVVAGFLLTAVRNWTGLSTPTGSRLAILVGVWLAGRLIPFAAGLVPDAGIAAVDLAFLPTLAFALALPLAKQPKLGNLVFVPVLGFLTLANLLVHLQALGLTARTARPGIYLAVDLVVLLMVVMGGRVIPLFTRNALGSEPRSWNSLEELSIGSVVALAALRLFTPDPIPFDGVRIVAALAAAAHLVRLAGWYDARIWSRPLLWVLFVGYGWIVAGFALIALSPYLPFGPLLGLHAHTAGAMGTLTLGMMARVALGHTGRPLEPPRALALAFGSISLAAAVRVLVPILAPPAYPSLVIVGGTFWVFAFLLFAATYVPILVRPRVDGKPG